MRVKALVRRASGSHRPSTILKFGDLSFDTATYTATRAGTPVTLTKTGYKILRCLMREAPKLVPRDKIEQEVWGDDRPDSDALRTHIHSLRQTLDKDEPYPMLRTVPGIGYQLVTPHDPL